MKFCSYYQAQVVPAQGWFFVAIIRSYEHVCFDRTLDVKKSIFEFFVPPGLEQQFEAVMNYFEQNAIIKDLKKLPNRFKT